MLGLKLIHVSKRGHWQRAITWANVEPGLCHLMASQGHSELIQLYCWVKTILRDHPQAKTLMSDILDIDQYKFTVVKEKSLLPGKMSEVSI